jgi:hypothetical protein
VILQRPRQLVTSLGIGGLFRRFEHDKGFRLDQAVAVAPGHDGAFE